MEMFLMVAVLSLMGVGVSALLFAAATRSEGVGPARPEAEKATAGASRFFADNRAPVPRRVETEELLLQLERHISLERAAAESFLEAPTAESLHGRTASPLRH